MPLIILGVLVFGGLLALLEISRNKKGRFASSRKGKANGVAPIIYLPTDIEREKRKRNII